MQREEYFTDLRDKIYKSNQSEYLKNIKRIDTIKPLVSVTVITYQHANYIQECLDSILMQETNFSFEIIIGEDESTDGTREICKEYAERYPDKIRLFLRSREDVIRLGDRPTGKFNGLATRAAARGKYIASCEGDDYWLDPKKLQKQVSFMESNPNCTMCIHAAVVVDLQGNKIGEKRPLSENGYLPVEEIIKRGGGFIPTASRVYQRKIMDPEPEWVIRAPIGDYPQQMLCGHLGSVWYIDEVMSAYRAKVPGSWTSGSTDKRFIESRLLMLEMFDAFNDYSNGKYTHEIEFCKQRSLKKLFRKVKREHYSVYPQLKELALLLPPKERMIASLHLHEITRELKSSIKKRLYKKKCPTSL